jgi:hypothetical protein
MAGARLERRLATILAVGGAEKPGRVAPRKSAKKPTKQAERRPARGAKGALNLARGRAQIGALLLP